MGLPVFIENSRIPSVLSKVSPIEIGAITLGPIIISKGKMDETLRRHETIHWEQYKECLIVGFLFLYLFFWLRNLLNGYDGKGAYYNIPFEREAYDNQHDSEYLLHRKRFAWASPRDIKMKITHRQLRRIIREELTRVQINESGESFEFALEDRRDELGLGSVNSLTSKEIIKIAQSNGLIKHVYGKDLKALKEKSQADLIKYILSTETSVSDWEGATTRTSSRPSLDIESGDTRKRGSEKVNTSIQKIFTDLFKAGVDTDIILDLPEMEGIELVKVTEGGVPILSGTPASGTFKTIKGTSPIEKARHEEIMGLAS